MQRKQRQVGNLRCSIISNGGATALDSVMKEHTPYYTALNCTLSCNLLSSLAVNTISKSCLIDEFVRRTYMYVHTRGNPLHVPRTNTSLTRPTTSHSLPLSTISLTSPTVLHPPAHPPSPPSS